MNSAYECSVKINSYWDAKEYHVMLEKKIHSIEFTMNYIIHLCICYGNPNDDAQVI